MSQRTLSAEKLQEIRELAVQWGRIVARRAFGDAGPGLDIDFSTMEQIASAATAGLTEGTLSTLLDQQAQSLPEAPACPDCQRPCPVSYEDRTLTAKGGQLPLREPICHCPDCRRDFFPPADLLASGRTQLQPRRGRDDR
jgi:hypothetical protein